MKPENHTDQIRFAAPKPNPVKGRQPAWPHAPSHCLSEHGTYFVTCSTYNKINHFKTSERLFVLQRGLLKLAHEFHWKLEAWAIFSNHYHFIAHSPDDEDDAKSLPVMSQILRSKTARWINKLDNNPGRTVWHNYWDTKLTYPKAYLARLNYVHQNPVKHDLVPVAALYPWCSAGWFERTATAAQVKTIYGFKIDALNVYDEFDVSRVVER